MPALPVSTTIPLPDNLWQQNQNCRLLFSKYNLINNFSIIACCAQRAFMRNSIPVNGRTTYLTRFDLSRWSIIISSDYSYFHVLFILCFHLYITQEQMMYKDELPKPQNQPRVYLPNSYKVPTEKKRQALRWAVRTSLAHKQMPNASAFEFWSIFVPFKDIIENQRWGSGSGLAWCSDKMPQLLDSKQSCFLG